MPSKQKGNVLKCVNSEEKYASKIKTTLESKTEGTFFEFIHTGFFFTIISTKIRKLPPKTGCRKSPISEKWPSFGRLDGHLAKSLSTGTILEYYWSTAVFTLYTVFATICYYSLFGGVPDTQVFTYSLYLAIHASWLTPFSLQTK